MPDLFGAPELPEGFRYLPDVLSTAEERELVGLFESLPLQPFEFHGYRANRRIFTYGHRYVFAGQQPRADAGIPAHLRPLAEIASAIAGVPADMFEQVMVTEYPPGCGHRLASRSADLRRYRRHLLPLALRVAAASARRGRLGATVGADRTAICLFIAWSGSQSLAAQHRGDG